MTQSEVRKYLLSERAEENSNVITSLSRAMTRTANTVFTVFVLVLFVLQGCISLIDSEDEDGLLENGDRKEFERPDQDVYECFDYDNWNRCFITYIPESVNETSRAPLIVELHGWAESAPDTRNHTEVIQLADQVGAVVVHAEGIIVDNSTIALGGNEESWNAGYCCGDAVAFEIDDVGYLREVIRLTLERYPIDENRVYLTGWSNGCMMAQRMALEASDVVTAVACTSGYLSFHETESYSPVPVMEIHGFIDENSQYTNTANWGLVDENRRNLESIQTGAIENMYDWAAYNDCENALPDRNEPGTIYSIQGFTECASGSEVVLITVHAGGHNLYGKDLCSSDVIWNCLGNQGLYDTNQLQWDFLSRFSKNIDDE